MNFQAQNSHISPLFKKPSGLKFEDKINLESIILISKSINNLLPPLFSSSFKFSSDTLTVKHLGPHMSIFIKLPIELTFMVKTLSQEVQLSLGIKVRTI